MKKTCSILLLVIMIMAAFSGCSHEKPTAVESVQAIYDLYILGDSTGVSELGMSDEDISIAQTSYDAALANTIRSNFATSGLEIEDDTIDAICQARKEALSHMTAEFVLTSEEDDTAVVTIHTTYFDEVALDTDAAYSAREAADAAGFTEYDEYLQFIMETYTQNLIRGYEDVTPSEDTKSIVVECTIIDNMWLPKDMATFGSELGLTVAGMEE